MAELPAWVYDVVIQLQRWEDEHPKLYAEFYDLMAGGHVMKPVGECGCQALNLVPAEVRAAARAIGAYVAQRPPATVDRPLLEGASVHVERTDDSIGLGFARVDAGFIAARPGDTPGQLVPGEYDEPKPIDAGGAAQ